MIELAFYKGAGRISDRVIKKATRSIFSHVEMLDPARPGFCWSSSGRDGGVRGKSIDTKKERWEVIALPWAKGNEVDRIKAESGKPYDYLGLVGSQIFNLRRHDRDRWFCSEICAWALGLEMSQEYSPGTLYRTVNNMNRAYALGANEWGNRQRIYR